MKVTKKELPASSEVELTVELSLTELQPYLENASKAISKEYKLPGFRPGQVPYEVLKKHVPEAQIYEQAFPSVVNKTLVKATEQEKIDFIGRPKVEPEKIAPGNPLVYKALFALMPKVTLGDYKNFKAKKQKVVLDQKKVDQTLEHLRELRAQEKLVRREAKKGDKVIIDFTVKQSGVVIEGGQAKDYNLIIGDDQFIPGFEDQVVGLKAEENKIFVLTFPANYHQSGLSNKKCDFEVKIKSVFARTIPPLDDQMAQSFNFKNAEELKNQITDNVQKELEQKEQDRLELALLEEVMARSEFSPLPSALIETEGHKMMHELEHQISGSGAKFEDYLKSLKKTKEDLAKEFAPQAVKRIKTALITREIARLEKISAAEEEVEAELAKTLKMYQASSEMKKQFDNQDYRHYLKNILSNRKVFEFLTKFISE